jgi:SAM-dependent methyltransferase
MNQELLAADEARDIAICGRPLFEASSTRFASEGAHDPTPVHYFVLEELFKHYHFTDQTRLLDVGCGTGRVLAYFLEQGFPGTATGVEIDPVLAHRCASWANTHGNLNAESRSVLELPLRSFTDYFLFNPFDSIILMQFLNKLEREARQTITLIHLSDNGESINYWGREGWRRLAEGWVQDHDGLRAYDHPQHYSVWEYDPKSTVTLPFRLDLPFED